MNALGARTMAGVLMFTAQCASCSFHVESPYRYAAEWRLFHHECVKVAAA